MTGNIVASGINTIGDGILGGSNGTDGTTLDIPDSVYYILGSTLTSNAVKQNVKLGLEYYLKNK